jgi:CsoR family transcriptional regulator, copper-sensing transcriptional repressor
MSENERHVIEARLARIEGHVHALHRMAHEGRPYPELVHQITAVRAALDSVLRAIVEDLVHECVTAAPARGRLAPIVQELRAVVESAL